MTSCARSLSAAKSFGLRLKYLGCCVIKHAWTIERIHESLGKPRTSSVSRLDDQSLSPETPPYTVESTHFSCPHFRSQHEKGLTRQLKIMDFEEASFERRTSEITYANSTSIAQSIFLVKVLGCQPTFGLLRVPFSTSSANALCSKLSSQVQTRFSWK